MQTLKLKINIDSLVKIPEKVPTLKLKIIDASSLVKIPEKVPTLKLKIIDESSLVKIAEKIENSKSSDTNEDKKFKTCSQKFHKGRSKDLFPRDKVPIERFIDPKTGKEYKNCLECRNYSLNSRNNVISKLKQENEKLKDSDFCVCLSASHNVPGISSFPKNKVPKELFYKNQGELNEIKYDACSDCRKYNRKLDNASKELRQIKAAEEDKFLCYQCGSTKNLDEKALDANGDPLTSCKTCQEKTKIRGEIRYKELREIYCKIQKEIIMKNECSCEVCKCIYLKIEDTDYSKPGQKFIQLFTRNENGVNYVDYLGKTYIVKDFLTEFSHLLELRVLEFDHLPENEQLEKGIIKTGEEPFLKNKCVSKSMSSESALRLEIRGCQLIDCLCHLKETMRREKGGRWLSDEEIQKMNYVNDIKKQGCCLCGFLDENLLRFIQMDHLNPKTKKETIGNMVTKPNFSLNEVKDESSGCRPLCKYCHFFFTIWQRENGIVWRD